MLSLTLEGGKKKGGRRGRRGEVRIGLALTDFWTLLVEGCASALTVFFTSNNFWIGSLYLYFDAVVYREILRRVKALMLNCIILIYSYMHANTFVQAYVSLIKVFG